MNKNVTKNIFLNTLAFSCTALGWILRNAKADLVPATLGDTFRMEQGREIELRARELYPDGLLIDDADPETAQKKTSAAIQNGKVSSIFSGTFQVDGYVTRTDILQRVKGGWGLGEVKSSVTDKPELVDDLAYTTMVAKRAGLKVSGSSLILISKDFRQGMSNDHLFVKIDHTDDVNDRTPIFEQYWDTVEKSTGATSKPKPELRLTCKKCALFPECLGAGIDHHIFEIPRLSQKKYDELVKHGITKIEKIPDSIDLSDIQSRVRECVKTNRPVIGLELKKQLESLSWPIYYLDFETVSTAIPLYANVAPYETLPVLFSLHKCTQLGKNIEHYEFLADPSRDNRKELAEQLIQKLGDAGSVVVYGSFEKTILLKLAETFPALANKIELIVERIVNLERIISTSFTHPDFHGGTSMKTVLPALVPELSYDSLEIKDGNSALAAFAYLALGRYQGDRIEEVKKQLKDYCCQDTLALYNIHQRLMQFATSNSAKT
jgi:hypothetical protein